MKIIALLIFVLTAMPVTAFAETECTDRPECWPEGSSMHTGLLLVEKQKMLEKLLASKQEDLVKLVSAAASSDGKFHADERLFMAFKAQQAAWLKYRTDECELIGASCE